MDTFTKTIECPHCGHHVHFEFDASNGDQDYFEDCSACCNPIHLNVHVDESELKVVVNVDADDEQIY